MKKSPASSILSLIAMAFAFVFGKLRWSSPPWASFIHRKANNSPFAFYSVILMILALTGAGVYGIYLYKNRTLPVYVSTSITTPDITANEETLIPNNLFIDFGIKKDGFIVQSVAPINLIGKEIDKGINITPDIKGQWSWSSDSKLVFVPKEDWEAGQTYNIHFEKDFFAPNVKIEDYNASFTTLPFASSIKEFKLYQDPVNPELRTAIATIEFNYPLNMDSIQKNTSLIFQDIKDGKQNIDAESLKFSYTYDKNKRIAYLHSEPVKLTKTPRYLILTLDKNISSSTDSAHLTQKMSQNLLVPDTNNFLKVTSSSAGLVRNEKDKPEQVLTIETSLGINETEFKHAVHLYLLPRDYPATISEHAKSNYIWQDPGQVNSSILSLSTPLSTVTIPAQNNYASLHSYKFSADYGRYVYIKIDKGMKGFGGFALNQDYQAIIAVPELPKEISFLHKGALLALSGEKKLSVLIRGVPAVKFDFARVLPENINQLITQTEGNFNNPYFINPQFTQQNISDISSEIQQFDASDLSKQQYTALDIGKYLSISGDTTGPQGLFLLKATGWDVEHNNSLDIKASRLILITNLGLLVKDNNDGSHDVFVNSITEGMPAAGVTVTILGKNGLPILTRVSDDQGRVHFPSLKNFVDDKEPTVYLANLNNDVSFIPYHNFNRQLNFSKFDIGGLYTNNQELNSLSAFLFSDRGIYRPGDTAHIAMIVKRTYAQSQPAGLPLQATVVDSRGTTIKDQRIILNQDGYMELEFTTSPNAPTGHYTINLFLVKDDHPQNLLGSTSVNVSEFLPDRMRITADLFPKPADGWSSPSGMKAKVDLWNLYGAPATDRKISAKILLAPQEVKFDKYPDYVFSDPLFDPKKPSKVFTETLTDVRTNDKGEAEFNLNLDRFEKATYQLTFFAEGFEADGGRSVTTQSKSLISPLPYFIGYKADGDLSFIKQDSVRTINYQAINPQLTKEEVPDLKLELVSLHPVTTLVKKADGTFQYQSIIQSTVLSKQPFSITESGTNYNLPTGQIGDFSLKVLNRDGTSLSQFKFSIVGASQRPLVKNAELSIKLNKEEYKPNEDIELQITAPYTGSGLITIERDKVYAAQWFKTDTTSSLQTIKIPADFEGNGYINVAFIRDWDSPELFVSPLSYSVVPFSINHEDHKVNIELQTPKVARPGESFTIDYHTDKPGKVIVFAVDEGILQVAHYTTPNPLAFFFQKYALEVMTQQTVDQILPKFIQDRELSAAGGDGGEENLASRLNPFKRKTNLPVVYWSGIVDSDTSNRQLVYNVPDYFNGSLKVMAVAVSENSVGSQDTKAEIRGDFIINPNVPTFVAPGDEFEVSSSIANNIKNSGDHTEIIIDLKTSPEIELISKATETLVISEGHEQTVHFKLRAKSHLGSEKITFIAHTGTKSAQMDATLSVRPATPLITQIDSGSSQTKKSLDVIQTFYPEHRKVSATMSSSPLILVFGLQRYLDNYPYGCTEQLTSKALPLLALNSQPWFSKDRNEIDKKMHATIQMLSERQMSNGGFSYWPDLSSNEGNSFASVYAMHFLIEARAQNFTVPYDMFSKGLSYLKDLSSATPADLNEARIQAYAIYLLTRNELVTSNYLGNLQTYLQKNYDKTWQRDITAVYIAGAYQLLKSYDDANRLISQYQPQTDYAWNTDFYDSNIADAQYLYIVAKHFPDMLTKVSDKIVMQLVQAINNNEINTILSGYISLALSAYPQSQEESQVTKPAFSITQKFTNNQMKIVSATGTNFHKIDMGADVSQIIFNNSEKNYFFYQLIQSGFDKAIPTTPVKNNLEIFREYRDEQGQVINSTKLGSEIEVHIQIRALENQYLTNIAIEDLLPGGFEVVRDSVKADGMDFVDAREDRVNFFGGVGSTALKIIYKIKAVNPGKYSVPPPYAEAMYDPQTQARGVAAEITITQSTP